MNGHWGCHNSLAKKIKIIAGYKLQTSNQNSPL